MDILIQVKLFANVKNLKNKKNKIKKIIKNVILFAKRALWQLVSAYLVMPRVIENLLKVNANVVGIILIMEKKLSAVILAVTQCLQFILIFI